MIGEKLHSTPRFLETKTLVRIGLWPTSINHGASLPTGRLRVYCPTNVRPPKRGVPKSIEINLFQCRETGFTDLNGKGGKCEKKRPAESRPLTFEFKTYDLRRRLATNPIRAQPIIAAEVGSGAATRPFEPPKVNVLSNPGPLVKKKLMSNSNAVMSSD